MKLEEDSQILLCSDGLSNMVSNEEIYRTVLEDGGDSDKAKRLIDRANENGGKDNIAVIVIEPFADEVKVC